jgi:FkbM family methyltransferase
MPDYSDMQVWRRTLRPGDVFVDVGANVGLYSVAAGEAGAHVISIEPQPAAVEQLKINLTMNGIDAEIHEVAVADAPGRLRLDGPDLNQQALVLSRAGSECEPDPEQLVSVTTLDELLGNRAIAGMKVDVEGAERLVLQGASAALAARRIQLIQLEWNESSQRTLGETRIPIVEMLRANGYNFYRSNRDGTLVPASDLDFGPDVFAQPTDDA